ncbi:MAG: glycosyltransferase family 39 protein [Phycisphaerae bacterium]|nr:glycosyltransferase family 39 protein [Phycisphaerae bacterium]
MTRPGDRTCGPLPGVDEPATGSVSRQAAIAILLGAFAVAHVIATRLSWSGIPLQTDTGMWAYIGSRILDGALPYRDLWESKPPGVYYTFAIVEWVLGVGRDGALLWFDAVLSTCVFAVTYGVARRFASRAAAAGAVLLLSVVFCHRVLADWGDNVEKFVALFEMTACWLVLGNIGGARRGRGREATTRNDRWRWLVAGVCCGLAALFKQTGVLFLVAATVAAIGMRRANQEAPPGRAVPVVLLWLGAAVPWLPVVGWMAAAGVFEPFWQQVVLYDLARVGSTEVERSRLATGQHWADAVGVLKLVAVLFGPALVGAIYWAQRRLWARTGGTSRDAHADAALLIVVLYWLLTTLVFAVAPYGYGHYLLQAAPPAAVIAAWLFERVLVAREPGSAGPGSLSARGKGEDSSSETPFLTVKTTGETPVPQSRHGPLSQSGGPGVPRALHCGAEVRTTGCVGADSKPRCAGENHRFWTYLVVAVLVVGIWPLRDHFEFTFDRTCEWRVAYDQQARQTRALVDAIQTQTTPQQSVMVWPSDYMLSGYAVLYYAGRATPLEVSNSDVIFKGKINRLSPPMPELLERLKAKPPDVVVDWTPVGVEPPAADGPDAEPRLLTPAGGFSFAEAPNDAHPMREGRTLAPLKRWLRANYGGQQRVGACTIYYRGKQWRPWQDVLLPSPNRS